jgi:VanZ family protein
MINKRLIRFFWLLTCVTILLMSVFGRSLQVWVAETIGYRMTAWILGLSTLVIVGLLISRLLKENERPPWVHFAWFLPLFLVVPLLLERVEERTHFMTFGLFGALSMALFPPRYALITCILGAAGDELLQFYLPDRVGDLRDVAFNALAALGAALFVYTAVLSRGNR